MIKSLLLVWLCVITLTFSAKAQTTAEYIAENVEYAQTLMREHKIPASVILAVAIHESASGTSKIARYLNNHFGIKGPNSNTEIRSSYRDYPSPKESYDSFLEFLKNRSSLSPLFDKYDQFDYRNWARGIHRGGYARSRTWASQIIGIIKRNNLSQYDERPDDYVEPPAPVASSPHRSAKKSRSTYTVKKGDSLNKIAKSRETTAASIMKKNGLKGAALKPGQKLKL